MWVVGFVLIALLGVLGFMKAGRDAQGTPVAVLKRITTTGMSGKIADVYTQLHEPDSGLRIKKEYPDASLVYTDLGRDKPFSSEKHPFFYFYSPEAGKTFGICSQNRSVLICDGKMDHRVTLDDVKSGKCTAAAIVLMRDSDLDMVEQLDTVRKL